MTSPISSSPEEVWPPAEMTPDTPLYDPEKMLALPPPRALAALGDSLSRLTTHDLPAPPIAIERQYGIRLDDYIIPHGDHLRTPDSGEDAAASAQPADKVDHEGVARSTSSSRRRARRAHLAAAHAAGVPPMDSAMSQDLFTKITDQNARLKTTLRTLVSSVYGGVGQYLDAAESADHLSFVRDDLERANAEVKRLRGAYIQQTTKLQSRILQLEHRLESYTDAFTEFVRLIEHPADDAEKVAALKRLAPIITNVLTASSGPPPSAFKQGEENSE